MCEIRKNIVSIKPACLNLPSWYDIRMRGSFMKASLGSLFAHSGIDTENKDPQILTLLEQVREVECFLLLNPASCHGEVNKEVQ